jgi:tRNA A37 threonylcarbamoyladenosine synthetase subunit TsaC/SUA5/YrdC
MAEFIKLYEENPDPRRIRQLVEVLKNGGVIIYPTDTVYSFGCDITQQKAVEKICRIKGINPKKHNFLCKCQK